jgi:hypothetical protein
MRENRGKTGGKCGKKGGVCWFLWLTGFFRKEKAGGEISYGPGVGYNSGVL